MLVDIVPVGNVSAEVKRAASSALRSVYDCDVTVNESQPVPNGAYDSGEISTRPRRSFNSPNASEAGRKHRDNAPRSLLSASKLRFRTRLSRRQRQRRLDLPAPDLERRRLLEQERERDLRNRVRKEIVHEIGHTFGLEHCDNNRCVMNFSPTVRGVDIKEENLCGSCQRLIR